MPKFLHIFEKDVCVCVLILTVSLALSLVNVSQLARDGLAKEWNGIAFLDN